MLLPTAMTVPFGGEANFRFGVYGVTSWLYPATGEVVPPDATFNGGYVKWKRPINFEDLRGGMVYNGFWFPAHALRLDRNKGIVGYPFWDAEPKRNKELEIDELLGE